MSPNISLPSQLPTQKTFIRTSPPENHGVLGREGNLPFILSRTAHPTYIRCLPQHYPQPTLFPGSPPPRHEEFTSSGASIQGWTDPSDSKLLILNSILPFFSAIQFYPLESRTNACNIFVNT